jgi:hypothetical protein
MKLESVIKQIISEQTTPNQLILKLIKSLGKKGTAEAESALIRAIRKEGNLGPKVTVDVNNVTEELMQRAIKNVEFASYRKLIAQKIYNKNQELFDDIITKSKGKTRILQLNNSGVPPAFQEEVRNLYKLKNKTITPKPTTTPTSIPTSSTLPILNNTGSLMSYIDAELKKFGLPKPDQKWIDDFVNDLNGFVREAYRKQGSKNIDITLDNLESTLRTRMTSDQRQSFYNKALENINLMSKKNKSFLGLYEGMKGKSLITKEGIKNFVDDYKRYAKYILIANAITITLDMLRKYVDTKKGQPYVYHLGDPETESYVYVKIAASIIPYLNVIITTALAGESLGRTGISIFGRENLNKEKSGTSPFEGGDSKDNEDVLDGIKNDN